MENTDGGINVMKRIIALVITLSIFILCMIGCTLQKYYPQKKMIGMTSIEMVEKYGRFDIASGPPDEDGLYRRRAAGYVVIEENKSLLGRLFRIDHGWYLLFTFDENGVAASYRYGKGGWGG